MEVINQAMRVIHFIGDFSLGAKLLEIAHAKDKHNITTGELLYYSYFHTVHLFFQIDFSEISTECESCPSSSASCTRKRTNTRSGIVSMYY